MSNNSNKGRLIIFSAPSGAGKSSLIKEIIDLSPNKIELSISATKSIKKENIEIVVSFD